MSESDPTPNTSQAHEEELTESGSLPTELEEPPPVLTPVADEFPVTGEDDQDDRSSDEAVLLELWMIEENTAPSTIVTRGSRGIYKPNPRYALAVAATEISIPKSAKSAITVPQWKEAMSVEYKALMENQTWTLVPRQSSDNVISKKWVFKVKAKSDGSIERYKARLVANSMHQVQGSDYLDTFSSVVHSLSICLVLTLVVTRGWKIHS